METMLPVIELRPLEPGDTDRFAAEMSAAFQLAVDTAPQKEPLPVLPRGDIDKTLAHPDAEALVAWQDGKPVGGAVLFLNIRPGVHECALLYVAATAHGRGIGTALWKAIEAYHPEALAWELCTPYFEKRNIHFYLRKCGFHIVDLFREEDGDAEAESGLMFSFLKRMDGRWE